tara:strand:+ start:109 stop:567 length:459 start_codon:yes stop_codon:yes gene_type:complete
MIDHKFLTAHFINNEKTTVAAQWEDSDGVIREMVTEAEEGNLDWEEILTHLTLDDVYENTVKNNREQREAFESMVKGIAEGEGLTFKNLEQDEIFDIVINTITEEIDAESLFKFKLKIFDIKSVKESKDRSVKAEIRTSKNIAEAIAALSKM